MTDQQRCTGDDGEPGAGPLLVLVHGAWHGSWAWARLLGELRRSGVDALAVDLPGVDRAPGRPDLQGHAEALVTAVSEMATDTGVVLCGHSYGGAVISEAAPMLPNVIELIYIAGFQLDEGQSGADANPASAGGDDLDDPVGRTGDLLTYSPGSAVRDFYHDCSARDAREAAARLTPEHVDTVMAPQGRTGWRSVPSTYVVTLQDRALWPQNQRRMAERAGRVREMDTGHSPMLSRPAQLAALLAELTGS